MKKARRTGDTPEFMTIKSDGRIEGGRYVWHGVVNELCDDDGRHVVYGYLFAEGGDRSPPVFAVRDRDGWPLRVVAMSENLTWGGSPVFMSGPRTLLTSTSSAKRIVSIDLDLASEADSQPPGVHSIQTLKAHTLGERDLSSDIAWVGETSGWAWLVDVKLVRACRIDALVWPVRGSGGQQCLVINEDMHVSWEETTKLFARYSTLNVRARVDTYRHIEAVADPDGCAVVGLDKQRPEDVSFVSREKSACAWVWTPTWTAGRKPVSFRIAMSKDLVTVVVSTELSTKKFIRATWLSRHTGEVLGEQPWNGDWLNCAAVFFKRSELMTLNSRQAMGIVGAQVEPLKHGTLWA
jgi:hypothetical protein